MYVMANIKHSILDFPKLKLFRIWAKVDKNGSVPEYNPELGRCWLWTGHIAKGERRGYGFYGITGNYKLPAHRVIYELTKGRVDSSLEMDHLCRVRHCVNPDHLEPVTNRENQRRGFSWAGINARTTHCPAGHEYTYDNTYVWKSGMRRCRECNNATARAYRARLRESRK